MIGPMIELFPRPEWQAQANCRGLGPEHFFGPRQIGDPRSEGFGWKPSDDVRALCEACPVRDPCLDQALALGEYGYWGGTSIQDRKRLKKASA
jgi:WhiB family redox-sensing transcriptional regulator